MTIDHYIYYYKTTTATANSINIKQPFNLYKLWGYKLLLHRVDPTECYDIACLRPTAEWILYLSAAHDYL